MNISVPELLLHKEERGLRDGSFEIRCKSEIVQGKVDSSWSIMAQGDAREGKWRGNWRMEWVASTLHTTSEHGVSSITTADAHTSAVSSRLKWRPRRFKWIRPFRRKTKSRFCARSITFQLASTYARWRNEVMICIKKYCFLQHAILRTLNKKQCRPETDVRPLNCDTLRWRGAESMDSPTVSAFLGVAGFGICPNTLVVQTFFVNSSRQIRGLYLKSVATASF